MKKRGKQPLPVAERFWPKVRKQDDGCWIWTANKNGPGYGLIRTGSMCDGTRRYEMAHRVSLKLAGIEIPEGYDVDHLCRVPLCVNPDHLEPVSRKENLRRGIQGGDGARRLAMTHCKYGHEYTKENTYITKAGHRSCRACGRIAQQKYQEKKKANERSNKD